MDKRLAKRHKRQVARAKAHVKTSEPDLRTQEQIEAARAASQSGNSFGKTTTTARGSSESFRNTAATSTGSAAKTGI